MTENLGKEQKRNRCLSPPQPFFNDDFFFFFLDGKCRDGSHSLEESTQFACCYLSSADVFVFRCPATINVSLSVVTVPVSQLFKKVSFAAKEFYFPL